MAGSRKISGTCPAKISKTMFKADSSIAVDWISTHFGHDNELRHMNIPQAERSKIVSMLHSKVPESEILVSIRSSIQDNKLTRSHLITTKDISNLRNKYAFGEDGRLHKDDLSSVQLLAEKMSKNKSDAILLKRIGEELNGFCNDQFILIIITEAQQYMLKSFGNNIICIDSTHGTNPYNIQLTTIMVIDNN